MTPAVSAVLSEAWLLLAEAPLPLLAEGSLRAVAMALTTALVLALFRVRDARVRHAAWTAMLLMMLLSPLAIAWGPKARVPVRAAEPIVRAVGLDTLALPLPAMPLPETARPAAAARTALAGNWWVMACGLYVAVVVVMCVRIVIGMHRVRRLLRGAIPRQQRDYLIHPAAAVPIVVGWFRPRIILPIDCHEWPADRLAMVLAHEQAHARRRDSVVRLLSLINRAVFWFHPLAWWLHREIAALAEEACDATAAAAGPGRGAYADCLIAIARHARRAGQRIEPAAIGMASTALGRRVRAILADPAPPLAPRLTACVRVIGALLLIACLTATPVRTIAAFRLTPGAGDDAFHGFAGTFVVRDDRGTIDVRYNAEAADLRFSPCSTFKLPFAVMFLENGIVRDPDAIVKYDPRLVAGLMSGPPGTAHDQSLTSAFHESANWYFDTLSRSLDRADVAQFTSRSGYGNATVRDAAVRNTAASEHGSYWYDGGLRISANEQVAFLQRLHNGKLGLSARTTGLIKQMAQVEETPRWRLAAKTGACQGAGEETTTHWYVGWVEKADNTYYFALRFAADGFEPALRARIPIARDLLTQLNILD